MDIKTYSDLKTLVEQTNIALYKKSNYQHSIVFYFIDSNSSVAKIPLYKYKRKQLWQ